MERKGKIVFNKRCLRTKNHQFFSITVEPKKFSQNDLQELKFKLEFLYIHKLFKNSESD